MGKTANVKNRWKSHVRTAEKGLGFHLHDAIRLYGADDFEVSTISCHESEVEAYEEEARLIAEESLVTTGYNSSVGISSTDSNCEQSHVNHSIKTKRTWTVERRLEMSKKYTGPGNPFWSKTHDPETLEKMSLASRNMSPEHREKIRQANLGHQVNKETRKKMSESSPTRGKTLEEAFGKERADAIREKQSKREPLKGSRHPLARLTENDVLDIRQRSIGKSSDEALASEYGVSTRTIEKVRLRQSWRHI